MIRMTAEEIERKSAANRAAHAPRKVDLMKVEQKFSVKKAPKVKPPSEHDEAKSLTLWVDFQFPLWGLDPRLFAAIPNGGQRHPAIGGKMKAEGCRAGYPDYFLSVTRLWALATPPDFDDCYGLYIELKALDGTEQQSQKEYADILKAQGYAHHFCYGHAEAIRVISDYLGREHAG